VRKIVSAVGIFDEGNRSQGEGRRES